MHRKDTPMSTETHHSQKTAVLKKNKKDASIKTAAITTKKPANPNQFLAYTVNYSKSTASYIINNKTQEVEN